MNPGKANRPRIVVVRGGAIGDFILTLPVLAALRKQFPDCELLVIGYPQMVELAVAGALADAVWPIEARALAGFFARGGALDPELQALFAGAALVVSYLYDPDQVFQDNVARCGRAQFVVGPHRPDDRADRHATQVFLEPLRRLAIYDADPVPRLVLGRAEAGRREGRWVALHPGSGSDRKNWPEPCWLKLIESLLEAGKLELLVVGGEAEGERLDRIATRFHSSRLHLARNLPLASLAGELARCVAFVGHDSGITHLAAALGLPGLVLWGPSREAVWRPNSDHMVLLQAGDGLAKLSVSTVQEGLLDLLARTEDAQAKS